MAGPTRLELATSCVTGRRSNRTELRPREWMLKNAHLRRQDLKFELQRTTQYASAQISSPSLHLGIFEHPLFNLCYNMLRWTPQKILNVLLVRLRFSSSSALSKVISYVLVC